MRSVWIFFILFYQVYGCLDVLVRSFNEIFSPIIETGENRIEKPHNLDEISKYYKTDEHGNILPNLEEIWNSKYQNKFKYGNELVGSRKRSEIVSSAAELVNSDSESNKESKKKKNQDTNEQGTSPLANFFSRFMDLFKLAGEAEYILARPRHKDNKFYSTSHIDHDGTN